MIDPRRQRRVEKGSQTLICSPIKAVFLQYPVTLTCPPPTLRLLETRTPSGDPSSAAALQVLSKAPGPAGVGAEGPCKVELFFFFKSEGRCFLSKKNLNVRLVVGMDELSAGVGGCERARHRET